MLPVPLAPLGGAMLTVPLSGRTWLVLDLRGAFGAARSDVGCSFPTSIGADLGRGADAAWPTAATTIGLVSLGSITRVPALGSPWLP